MLVFHDMSPTEEKRGPRGRGKFGNKDISDAVREAILKSGSCRVAELAKELHVSEVSVRKSLNELERQGIVRRHHGEARTYDGDDIPFRMHVHYAEKQAISSRAAALVEPGDTILLEAGSAIAMFAQRIRDVQGLTVITTNLFIARSFRGSKARVIVLGGLYQEESESMVGPAVCESMSRHRFFEVFPRSLGVHVRRWLYVERCRTSRRDARDTGARGAMRSESVDSHRFLQIRYITRDRDLLGPVPHRRCGDGSRGPR